MKQTTSLSPCSAASILKSLNISSPIASTVENIKQFEEETSNHSDTFNYNYWFGQVREEAKEVSMATATVEGGGGRIKSWLVSSLKNVLPWLKVVLSWERPTVTLSALVLVLAFTYKEWIGYAITMVLMLTVGMMFWARRNRIGERCKEIVLHSSSDKTTMDNIVSAQQSMNKLHVLVKTMNITILRIWSLLIGKAPKQANAVMWVMTGVAVLLMVVPVKFVLMGVLLYCFIANSGIAKHKSNEQGNRRLKEWWESIPVVPVRTVVSSFPGQNWCH
ncbi:unnamed protein product [Musa hybrid cultivar]